MPLPFMMQAAKIIADRAKEVAQNAAAVSNAVAVTAQAATKAFSETQVGQQIGAKAGDVSQVVGAKFDQVNAFVDSNPTLSSARDAGGVAAHAVGTAAGHVSGAAGHVVGGLAGFAQSGQIVDQAKERHHNALAAFKPVLEELHKAAVKLETQKHVVMGGSFQRFIELFERQKQRMKISEKDFQTNLSLTPEEVREFEQVRLSSTALVQGAAQSVATGAAVGSGAVGLVMVAATASTGTALASLSGAAATNAMLAWFGGGSIASGGFGMAGGVMVLGGIFVAPAVGVATLIAAQKGHEALTKAVAYTAEVNTACANLDLKTQMAIGLQERIAEVSDVIAKLDARLVVQVRNCEQLERQSNEVGDDEKREFFKAGAFASALSKILSVPIYNQELEQQDGLVEAIFSARQVGVQA